MDDRVVAPLDRGEVRLEMAWGGICGSDLHFYRDGGVGASIVRNPMVLGHELSGIVCEIADDVEGFKPGDPVAIHPARLCGECLECRNGRNNLCRNVRFLGSAALNPHCDGGFRRYMTVQQGQLRHLPAGLDLEAAALTEPLAVVLHAINRAGPIEGRSVLVQGAGPIGVLLVAALRLKNAGRIVATDLNELPLEIATGMGATEAWNTASSFPEEEFDVVFEATGVAAALASAITRTRRGGVLAQVGIFAPGPVSAPLSLIVSREIDFRGCWRFDAEFDEALALLAEHKQQLTGLVTHKFDLPDCLEAFHAASDRKTASKVLLRLNA
ncbi:L-idonate 5-dehydrogenase [Bradyrhizobium sp.]|uniref:L-idonate 5-dehydrogenase n=1 Tax=Bradyrhizobium sp. TaxID=376 RepID=UPI0039E3E1CD